MALTLSLSACSRASAPAPAAPTPDVILITIDTLRADHVDVIGGNSGATPTLDALGRDGSVFLDATSQAPLTLPAHASILTGRYPTKHGIHDNSGFTLESGVPTLAELLKPRGYHTAAFVSSYVLRASTGLNRGFDAYDDRFEGIGLEHVTLSSLERRGSETGREVARWLAQAQHPYFLWAHFYDPHAPYDPPPAFAARFPDRPYDGEIATSDFGVAAILQAIASERRSSTLVIVTGDHGESLGEHGESQHGMLLYDSTLHVPLIVSGDGVPKARVSRQVRHVDIVPTVLDLVGLPVPAGMDGQSLVPLWKAGAGDRPGDAPLSYAETRFGELHFGWAPLASGRDGQWKYVDAPGGELYDLRNDPRETDNRVEAQHDTAAGLSRALRQVGSTDAQPRPSADADAAERLRSLGYASGRNEIGNPGANPRTEIARYEAYVKTFNAGLEQLEGNDARGAEQTFRSLARQFPRAFEAHQYLARALASRRAYADAAAEYELALTLNATEPALYFDAARALAADRRFDRAFELVKEGRRRDPGSFYGPLAEGFVAAAAGDTDRAERAFDDALARNPGLAAAHFELGHLAESKNDRARAEAEYQKALDADPSMTPARLAVERLQSRNR